MVPADAKIDKLELSLREHVWNLERNIAHANKRAAEAEKNVRELKEKYEPQEKEEQEQE